ncbi:protein DDI1 homolog 2-like [Lineus longissimus]|uniref:protein DDI1 homolog 2-like n=1 Tax=Lineus longissimus TaxID=88925 RepID=UPI002B4EE87A
MRVTFMLDEQIVPLEVSEDMEIRDIKALCISLLDLEHVPSSDLSLIWHGQVLSNLTNTLKSYGVADDDLILIEKANAMQQSPSVRRPPPPQQSQGAGRANMIDFSQIRIPGSSQSQATSSPRPPVAPQAQQPTVEEDMPDDPATIFNILRDRPDQRAVLKVRNPPLSEALEANDLVKFTAELNKQRKEKTDRELARIALINSDPFDMEAQRKIAEEIRLKNVESNMETAMEYSPESFGQVVMLYIDCMVNGHYVKAFVDSGAQMTIMSQACAERCGIMRLVDVRWAGIAKGVGVQKIIGRVHLGQIKIGDDFLQSSFSILEEQPMDMLLGLDMLKRHQCCIDLKRNVLTIGTTGTETPFLPESDLPEHARLNRTSSVTDMEDNDRMLAEALAKSSEEASAGRASGSAAGRSGQSSSTGSSATPQYPEADIQKIVSRGFSRQQALAELRHASGDLNKALIALITKSIGKRT